MKLAYFQLALAMILVGMNVAVGKVIVEKVPIFLFSEIRFLIALLFLIPMAFFHERSTIKIEKQQFKLLFLQSFFGVFLFSICMLYGVRYTSATAAGIITSTVPAAIALLSFFFLKERLSTSQVVSVCLAVLGILIITLQTSTIHSQNQPLLFGNILIFGAVVSEALFTIYAKKLAGVLSPIHMAAAINLIGFLLFLPFAIHEGLSFQLANITMFIWILIMYYAITASVLSFVFWYQGITKVKASIAGIFTGFIPVTAAVTGIFMLDEPFGWNQFFGILFVLAAIFVGTRKIEKDVSSKSL
ncbi:DMT family transporter [Bacillus manliponensis]|uniref:DMT family transporter n=1 Tax=Bacillus manliponensis TaxID=574376 RepID=UPI0035145ACF